LADSNPHRDYSLREHLAYRDSHLAGDRNTHGYKGRLMKVTVIGAGPAGLAAAHAASGLGCEAEIIAPREKTPQRGPLLLQRPLPGITKDHPDGYIKQLVIGGSVLDYRYKLYGDVNININGDVLQPGYHAWQLDRAYDELWERYSPLIDGRVIGSRELAELSSGDNLVVSTAPLSNLCSMQRHHDFRSKAVALTPGASYPNQPANTIVFNAGRDESWVRSSDVFGHKVTEWPVTDAPEGHRIILKPISTNCNCFPRVLLTGRFGKWRNETWVDTAYYDVRDAIISARNGSEWDRVR
jgi:hypothetical protein